jgi:O-antigen ligase
MALTSTSGGAGDVAGEASNAYRIAEAKALWGYIKQRPIYGYGFGKVATDFSTGYSYELSYLDLALKAGILGLLLYLSFPFRLVVDALRLRRVRHPMPDGLRGVGASGVVVGVVTGILLAGATNPFLFAAFGLVSILVMVAWLERDVDPDVGPRERSQASPKLL